MLSNIEKGYQDQLRKKTQNYKDLKRQKIEHILIGIKIPAVRQTDEKEEIWEISTTSRYIFTLKN